MIIARTVPQIVHVIERARVAIRDYCQRGSVLADAMATPSIDGPTCVEKVLYEMSVKKANVLKMRYVIVDPLDRSEKEMSHNYPLEPLPTDQVKAFFQDIRAFTTNLLSGMEARFPDCKLMDALVSLFAPSSLMCL